MDKRFVYADNAATTPVSQAVVDAMMPCFTDAWGNPSSIHQKGRQAAELLRGARQSVAQSLGCRAEEIYFTSSGSEADSWAVKGAAFYMRRRLGRRRIVTSTIEHHAVLNACAALEREGFEVIRVGVDEMGCVRMDELAAAVNTDTALVAVMYANNEIGTLQPVAQIARIAHEAGALMFTDAVQAVGAVPINLESLPVDMLSLSGHKIHAPKGVGALFIRRGVSIDNLIDGGGQERRRRGGTENVAFAVALARALADAVEALPDMERVVELRDRLIRSLCAIPYSRLNGDPHNRLPGNCNISFSCIEGESMLLWLDMAGICASTGSACSSDSLDPSHVLLAIGVPHEQAHGSLRLSISHETTEEDVSYILEQVPAIVERLRAMSPLWENGHPVQTKQETECKVKYAIQ